MKPPLHFYSSRIGKLHKPCLIALYAFLITACAGNMPNNLGIKNLQLQPCPSSPNCVSSFDTDAEHSIAPIFINEGEKQIKKKLLNLIKQHSNMRLVHHADKYIYAQYTSGVMGFVDDMEFLITGKKVEVRSASRLGYSDLGANRNHIEIIRERLK